MVVEYFAPGNGKTGSLQSNGKIRLMIEGMEFGFFGLKRIHASRYVLAEVSVIPRYRKDMANEMVHFMPDGKVKKRIQRP